jgi:cytochrome c
MSFMKRIAYAPSRPSRTLNGTIAGTAVSLATAAAIVVGSAAAHAEPNPEAGQKAFGRCASCHSLQAGENGIGPSLAGVFGRQSGSVSGFDYSNALKSANLTWDEASLDKYLQNPAGFIRGTRMFVGVQNPDDRRNVIAFLKGRSSE